MPQSHNRKRTATGGSNSGKNKNVYKKRKNNNSNNHSEMPRRPKHQKLEIKFDPEARRQYLTSLSSKKKERRVFGLAMQAVKDRRAKIEQRREEQQARMEQIEEAERLKSDRQRGQDNNDDSDDDGTAGGENEEHTNNGDTVTTTFQDDQTQSQFGGEVIVTTTYGISSDEEDDDKDQNEVKNASNIRFKIDEEQKYAGNVKKYMEQLKGKLPSKRNKNKTDARGGKRGRHGAEGMKGMGNAKDLKVAQKTLNKFRAKNDSGGGKGRKGGGKRGRDRR